MVDARLAHSVPVGIVTGAYLCLTPGEALWLWRRRNGLNRAGAALALGIPQRGLRATERGTEGAAAGLPLYVTRPRPTPLEATLVARRRSGLTSGAIARRLGISRMMLWKWERASDPRLAAFWENYRD